MQRNFAVICAALTALMLTVTSVAAQQSEKWDPQRAEMTRQELDALLHRLNQAAESRAYSAALRQRSRLESTQVKERLNAGDFQVGDRILLRVEGEQALSDTFVVRAGRVLTLPDLGDVPLSGILRSELEGFLSTQIARFVRQPVVHVRSLLRLSIVGRVTRPGFYLVPADVPLSDIVMIAGGPSQDADVNQIRIDRGAARLWEGEALRSAISEGRTIDQLSLRAGDQIQVPAASRANLEGIARVVAILVTIPAAIFGITRLF